MNLIMRITVTTTTPAHSARIPLLGIHGNSLNSRDSSQRMKPKILVKSFHRPFRMVSTMSFKKSVNHLKGFQPESLLPELPPPESPPGVGTVPPPGVGVAVGIGGGLGETLTRVFP